MRFLFALLYRSPRLWPALLALVFLLVGCGSVFSAPASTKTTSIPALSVIAQQPEFPTGPSRGGSVLGLLPAGSRPQGELEAPREACGKSRRTTARGIPYPPDAGDPAP